MVLGEPLQITQQIVEIFNKLDVQYLIGGSLASSLHGIPRATFDLDILIDATSENASRLLAAMLDAGLGTAR